MSKRSTCCGAEDAPCSYDGPNYSDIDICPECKEHCGWEEEPDDD